MLTVRADGATIEDLGSRNGVIVDGAPVVSRFELKDGNRIRIGNQEVQVRVSKDLAPTARDRADTPLSVSPSQSEGRRFLVETMAQEPTRTGASPSEFFKAAERADQAIAAGDAIEAESIIGRRLNDVLASMRAGARLDVRIPRMASTHALRLAQTRRSPYWIKYLFELYSALEVLMPREIVDGLHKLASTVGPIDMRAVDAYVAILSRSEGDMDAQEKGLLRRIAMIKDLASQRSGGKR